MLDPSNKDSNDLPLTIRAVFIIGPDKKLKLSLNYPASVGRNMEEIMRCIDALQLSAKHSVVSAVPAAAAVKTHSCMQSPFMCVYIYTYILQAGTPTWQLACNNCMSRLCLQKLSASCAKRQVRYVPGCLPSVSLQGYATSSKSVVILGWHLSVGIMLNHKHTVFAA